MRKYFVEFIGTFFLAFTVCAASLAKSGLTPIAAGAVLAAMIFAGGHISGGHFNPAVSVAVFVRGRIAPMDLAYYVAVQLVAGAAAAGVARYVVVLDSPLKAFTIGNGRPLIAAIVVELLFTFALAYTMVNVATSKDHPNNSFYGLAIGFVVLAGAVAVGGVSGGAFNPAVGLGVSLAGLAGWKLFWVYLLATVAGGALAGYAFRQLNPDDVAPVGGSAAPDKAAPAKAGVPTARRRT